ncbi:DUF4349 domain-containing protein [Nonomuraea pusilla]|uniref:DUF4349 domain-containing protein n=1 Tax=Nonomuraea pusilla TaxID=46177 RepID=A0A1H7LL61_9ACTN|nr:DUF4349 domain-containing protein [Nonomuraea pusilla]SEK99488.1 protein of unknown function [Nonomuraea pusilla]
MRRTRYGIALSAACAALVLAGCGGGSSSFVARQESRADGAAAPAAAPSPAADHAVPQDRTVAGQAGKTIPTEVQPTPEDRQIVYTASMTVRAAAVTAAAQQAKQIVTAAGGYLAREEADSSGDSEDSALLEFKVPPARYAEVLGRLGKDLGRQLSLNQNTQDVTLQVADVDSRLKTAQRSLESLRALLKKAGTMRQVLEVEREIAAREADLESLQAQQKELARQVAMATLTLRLVGPVAEVEDPADEPPGFLSGLKAGWAALVTSAKVFVTVFGAVLPWLVALGVPVTALVLLVRRRRRARRRPDRPSGPPAPQGPPARVPGGPPNPPAAPERAADASGPEQPEAPGPQ